MPMTTTTIAMASPHYAAPAGGWSPPNPNPNPNLQVDGALHVEGGAPRDDDAISRRISRRICRRICRRELDAQLATTRGELPRLHASLAEARPPKGREGGVRAARYRILGYAAARAEETGDEIVLLWPRAASVVGGGGEQ